MTPQQQLAFIKEKVIEAVPSIQGTSHVSTGNNLRCQNCGEPDSYENRGTCKKGKIRSIGLADVLLALEKKGKYILIDVTGNLYTHDMGDGSLVDEGIWNFLLPLDGQKEETIAWLHELLK